MKRYIIITNVLMQIVIRVIVGTNITFDIKIL